MAESDVMVELNLHRELCVLCSRVNILLPSLANSLRMCCMENCISAIYFSPGKCIFIGSALYASAVLDPGDNTIVVE